MNSLPRTSISIITATFNSCGTLNDCINSVNMQTYANIEHIFVDGASSDGTLSLIKERSAREHRWISEPDHGIYDALNKGISLSSGDVLGFLHSDDVLANSRTLSRIAEIFGSDPTVCGVFGDLQYVSKDDASRIVRNWRSSPFSHNKLNFGWMPPHPTLYVRREWYAQIGGLDTTYQVAADYLSILRLFNEKEFRTVYIPEVLVKMRLGGVSNRSFKSILLKTTEDWRALRSTGRSLVGAIKALTGKNLTKIGQFF
jgi:glycosyltransferase involved in cell wall biosynthesis